MLLSSNYDQDINKFSTAVHERYFTVDENVENIQYFFKCNGYLILLYVVFLEWIIGLVLELSLLDIGFLIWAL